MSKKAWKGHLPGRTCRTGHEKSRGREAADQTNAQASVGVVSASSNDGEEARDSGGERRRRWGRQAASHAVEMGLNIIPRAMRSCSVEV